MNAGKYRTAGVALAMGLAATPVAAQPPTELQGSAELGIAGTRISDEATRYGRYTGVGESDLHMIGNLSLLATREHRYLDLSIGDAGLDARRLRVEAGAAGSYSLALSHDRLPNMIHADALTPYRGVGGDVLTLPDTFTPGATTTEMAGLADSLQPLRLRTERRQDGLEARLNLDEHWLTRLEYRHERKRGVQHLGGVAGQSARFANTVLLPQPVDYETGTLDAGIDYDRGNFQFGVNYHLSTFSNAHRALTWDVPFAEQTARSGQAPDNRHQRISLDAAIALPLASRLSATIEFGRMDQDDILLPYSTDDIGGTPQVTEDLAALPRTSARAQIDSRHLGLNLTTNPLPRLGIGLRYRYHELDNRMPYTLFNRVINDTGPQSSAEDLYSRPHGYRQSAIDLNGRYRFAGGLGLRMHYRHETFDRGEHAPARKTAEDTVGMALNRRMTSRASWRISYSHARREADDYNAFRSYSTLYDTATCPPDAPPAVNPCFSNHPDLRMFHIANRTRDRVDAQLNLTPHEAVDLGIGLAGIRNRYSDNVSLGDTLLGLVSEDSQALTLDAGYSPGLQWALHVYYTHERMDAVQNGRAFTGAAETAIDASRNWRADFDNIIDTLGINAQFHSLDRRHSLMAGYILAFETGDIGFAAGDSLDAVDMPRNRIRRQVIELRGSRELNERMDIHLGAEYEVFRSRDRARDSITAGGTALDDVLPIAGALPDYRAVMLWSALMIRW